MKISEAASQSGLSVDTIRFYERSDLLPEIARGPDGNRHFSPEIIDWLILLASLRSTGMPMATMRKFASLYRHGDETISERREILLEHGRLLDERRADLDRCADLLAHKLDTYFKIQTK